MANLSFTSTTGTLPLHQRVQARLQARLSWVDEDTNRRISVDGITENIGATNALVNMTVLPKVGSKVKLRLYDEDSELIDAAAEVIRVERDPSKPQAALAIVANLKKWKDDVITAAQAWVTRDLKLNYEGDDWLN